MLHTSRWNCQSLSSCDITENEIKKNLRLRWQQKCLKDSFALHLEICTRGEEVKCQFFVPLSNAFSILFVWSNEHIQDNYMSIKPTFESFLLKKVQSDKRVSRTDFKHQRARAVSHNTTSVDSAAGGRPCLLIAWIPVHTEYPALLLLVLFLNWCNFNIALILLCSLFTINRQTYTYL